MCARVWGATVQASGGKGGWSVCIEICVVCGVNSQSQSCVLCQLCVWSVERESISLSVHSDRGTDD